MLGGFHLGDRFAQFCRNRIPTRIERSVRIRFGERRIVPNCACTLTAKFRPDLLGVRRDRKIADGAPRVMHTASILRRRADP